MNNKKSIIYIGMLLAISTILFPSLLSIYQNHNVTTKKFYMEKGNSTILSKKFANNLERLVFYSLGETSYYSEEKDINKKNPLHDKYFSLFEKELKNISKISNFDLYNRYKSAKYKKIAIFTLRDFSHIKKNDYLTLYISSDKEFYDTEVITLDLGINKIITLSLNSLKYIKYDYAKLTKNLSIYWGLKNIKFYKINSNSEQDTGTQSLSYIINDDNNMLELNYIYDSEDNTFSLEFFDAKTES